MKKIFLIFCMFFICCLCWPNNNTYAAWGGFVQTKQEKEEAIKEAKEVDLPALRTRAKFLKGKIEGLKDQQKEKIDVRDTLIKGVFQVLSKMDEINDDTGLPTEINSRGYSSEEYGGPLAPWENHNLKISEVINKLEEVIVIIDSIIGPERPASQN